MSFIEKVKDLVQPVDWVEDPDVPDEVPSDDELARLYPGERPHDPHPDEL